ncbi:ArsR/SmtB family transcription factor [Streptomyces sp. NBC_01262]|uniref:ArsR/SmtB family transcription factor n=1 Tax=Streptomyces sp. NBC_01262 TaxID=2903803 RepID=UPI002E2F2CCC|nr:metalloregulator ArsR/SmtB family transcription factor [Streptomyces sp. NBC_01262]
MSISASTQQVAVAPAEDCADDCGQHLACSLIDRQEAERLAGVLKAIADPTRLQLLHLILSAPNGEACVCDLTDCLGLRQPTISHHLKTMTAAGLLTRERRGTWVWYGVDHAGLEAVQEILRAPLGAGLAQAVESPAA